MKKTLSLIIGLSLLSSITPAKEAIPAFSMYSTPQSFFTLPHSSINIYKEANFKNTKKALVTAIIDGDTLLAQEKNGSQFQIRLLGINTPETTTSHTHSQCLSSEATAALALLLKKNRTVYIEDDRTNKPKDPFQRNLYYVYAQHPSSEKNEFIDLSEAMIALGYAKTFKKFPALRKPLYLKREEQATNRHEILKNELC